MMHANLLFILLLGGSVAFSARADDKQAIPNGGVAASPRASIASKSLNELLPSSAAVQRALFLYLREKAGATIPRPTLRSNLPQWAAARYRGVSNSKTIYALIQEDVFNASPLLSSRESAHREQALRTLHFAAIKSATELKDNHLCALVFDFLLPRRESLSNARGAFLSQQRLVQDGANAYRLTKQPEKQIAVLRLLVKLAGDEKNLARADWARIKLAEALAAQKQYDEAIELVSAVQSPNLKGSRAWINELKKQRDTQKK